MFRKLLTFTNIKVLAFSVVAPIIALSGVSGYIIANQKRMAVEQTVEQSVSASLYAAERELSKHLAAAEILASMVDLKRLDAFTVRIDEVMQRRRDDWLNVIVIGKTGHVYNYMRHRSGEPLPVSLHPDLDALVMTPATTISVRCRCSERYKEPFITIRVPILRRRDRRP